MEEIKSDFSQDNRVDHIDEEFVNVGAKIEQSARKIKIITVSVIGIMLLFGCWLGDRIIKESMSTARVTYGAGDMVRGIEEMTKGNQGAELKFKSAIISFEEAIEKDKNCSDAYFFMGVTYYHWYMYEKRIGKADRNVLEDLDKKIENNLIKATQIRRKFPEAYIYLGSYYCLKGMNSKASESFDRAKKIAEKLWKDKERKRNKWLPYIENAEKLIKDNKTFDSPPPLPDGIGV